LSRIITVCYYSGGDIMKLEVEKLNLRIFECNTYYSRLIGFMFKLKKINYGLEFKNCSAIHTMFMFQRIDIIMTDKDKNILYMFENVRPFRFINRRDSKIVYELPVGSINKIKSNY
jgi:hypothetical protein